VCLIPAVSLGILVQSSVIQRKNVSPIRNDAFHFSSIVTPEYSPSVCMAIFLNPSCSHARMIGPGLLGREEYTRLLREGWGAPSQYLTDNECRRCENDPHIRSPVAPVLGTKRLSFPINIIDQNDRNATRVGSSPRARSTACSRLTDRHSGPSALASSFLRHPIFNPSRKRLRICSAHQG
jgi:hypothetical protein